MRWKINQACVSESWSSHEVLGEMRQHGFMVDVLGLSLLSSQRGPTKGSTTSPSRDHQVRLEKDEE